MGSPTSAMPAQAASSLARLLPAELELKGDGERAAASMVQYYAQRATYYERVYAKPERQSDLRAMQAWMSQAFAGRRVLEVACGTGWWTPHGASQAVDWLATDLNPETMAVAQHKALPACVRFAAVDAYTWAGLPQGAQSGAAARPRFDAAFAGCWWSHVPLQRLSPWLSSLHAQLLPGARVVFLDNRFVQTSSTPLSHRDAAGNTYQTRQLDDGSQHEVLKNFPTHAEAAVALGPQADDIQWLEYTYYWLLSYRLK